MMTCSANFGLRTDTYSQQLRGGAKMPHGRAGLCKKD